MMPANMMTPAEATQMTKIFESLGALRVGYVQQERFEQHYDDAGNPVMVPDEYEPSEMRHSSTRHFGAHLAVRVGTERHNVVRTVETAIDEAAAAELVAKMKEEVAANVAKAKRSAASERSLNR